VIRNAFSDDDDDDRSQSFGARDFNTRDGFRQAWASEADPAMRSRSTRTQAPCREQFVAAAPPLTNAGNGELLSR
jgi:hypothetical protein